MEAFPNNPNVDGWGARKCNLQFASPRIPMSMVTTYLVYSSFGMHNKDAQQCGLRQRSASTQNMSWGGMKTWIPYPDNPSALKTNCSFCFNILLVTTLRYTMLTVNRSNQQALHHGVSSMTATVPVLWKHLQTIETNVDLLFGGCFFSHWRSAGIPRIIYPQRPSARAASAPQSATQRSHKDLGFFHGADTTVVLRARNTGMHQV